MEQRIYELREECIDASMAIRRLENPSIRNQAIRYRDGLIFALAIITGRDTEETYVDIEEATYAALGG